MSFLRPLNYGTLPSREYLNIVCRLEGLPFGVTSVDELHREMRALLAAGRITTLKVLLERVGFEWPDPTAATAEAHQKAVLS